MATPHATWAPTPWTEAMAKRPSFDYAAHVDSRHRAAFRGPLLDWFARVRRPMPWRAEDEHGRRDPYRVWLSEIMLQQTRVDQATPYFQRFTTAFPTVEALAAADLDDVLKQWEGLGYYSRARNLHRAAKVVVAEHGGRVPDTEAAISALPGIGPYTAAAVLSLAYGVPLAVLDGNVIRVLTRVFALGDDVKRSPVTKALRRLANELLPADHPSAFNEAVMELGATVCTPAAPRCLVCTLRDVCASLAEGDPTRYPVATKKKPVPHYDIAVGVVYDEQSRVLIQKRPEDAMLGGLWEFPGGKREPDEALEATCVRELREELGIDVEVTEPVARIDHAYSHFKITMYAFRCQLVRGTPEGREGQPLRWVAVSALGDYAFPRANRRLIETLQAQLRNPTLF
ncbi:MAG: A/G-specific adenine glycosylase [Bacteroidota bacterium]